MAQGDKTIMFDDARIIFRNFAGEQTKFNREGDRNFCVIIPDDLVDQLREDGWNVKSLQPREEGDPVRHYMKVSVSYKGRPPRVVLISSRGRTDLGQDQISMLDYVVIRRVDLIVRPYHWEVRGETGISAYLKTMYVTIEEDELDIRYADIPVAG